MRKLRDRQPAFAPEDFLRLALDARSPNLAGQLAEAGLKIDPTKTDPESAVLLWREVFKAHVHAGRIRSAHAIARKMVKSGGLPELGYADLGRSCAALGWWLRSAQAYRIAARFAPARRRPLHWGACASALHHARDYVGALAAIDRATRWSTHTRPLHRAYAALIRSVQGDNIQDLTAVESELEAARCGEGYGRYVLGLLALLRGDAGRGCKYLREFVRRNASDPMRSATLTAELSRARRALRTGRAAV